MSYKTIHLKSCVRCKSFEDLIPYSKGKNEKLKTIRQYYMCNSCNSKRHMKYYYNGGKERIMDANKRYMAKKQAVEEC